MLPKVLFACNSLRRRGQQYDYNTYTKDIFDSIGETSALCFQINGAPTIQRLQSPRPLTCLNLASEIYNKQSVALSEKKFFVVLQFRKILTIYLSGKNTCTNNYC